MPYTTVITIKNDTDSTFTLDTSKSTGLEGGRWPSSIKAGTESQPWNQDFDQIWSWQIKFEAWYNIDGTGNNKKICLKFYADGAEVFSESVSTDPSGLFSESSAKSGGYGDVTFSIVGTD